MAISYSSVDVMTVRDMIDAAIVFNDCNPTVDFNIFETILYILGRHLNLLERQIQFKMATMRRKVKKRIAVTEMKVHTRKKAKSKSTTEKSTTDKSTTEKSSDKTSSKPANKVSRKQPSSGDSSTDVNKKKKSRSKSRSRSRSKRRGSDGYTTLKAYAFKEKTGKGGRKFKTKWTDDEEKANVIREKLLIVSRTPSDSESFHRGSVVTEEQFNRLVSEVRKLQAKFGVQDMFAASETPWVNLHKPTSLTDPRAALNISARLNAAETKLTDMLGIVTKFARKIPGIDIDRAFDGRFLPQTQIMGHSSEETSKKGEASTVSAIQEEEMFMVEELLVPDAETEVEVEEDKNLATWKQLMDGLAAIRGQVVPFMSTAATAATGMAKNANKIFKETESKVNEAQQLTVKFVKLKFLSERFVNKVTILDNDLTSQMGDCQEGLSQMQFDLDTTLERLDDIIAHPKEDPNAVAAIKDDFTIFQFQLVSTKTRQRELENLLKHNSSGLDMLRRKIEALRISKTTRDEVIDALKDKASINDLNGLLSRDQYHAVIGFIQQVIHTTNERINTGEFEWQAGFHSKNVQICLKQLLIPCCQLALLKKCIDDYISELYEKANLDQLETLNHSINMYTTTMDITVNKMLDIVGPYPVTAFEKKLGGDGNCFSCGAPANVKVSDRCLQVAKEMMSRTIVQPPKTEDIEVQPPCIPGRPIPHPLDPRGLICERFCGASVCKTEESLPSSFGMDIIDINPVHTSDRHSQVYLRDLNIRCTPCTTHSEETFFK